MTSSLLELRGITKSFGGARVLDGIDLEVRPGEFLTFLGASGCGKTTTLRVVAGFESPDSGEVRLEGSRVNELPPYRRPVHTVFQHYALFPHYDIFENVAFGLRLKRLPEPEIASKVGAALALVQLGGFERRGVSELSGGQQQRVALARALVGEPKLLLLDEPLGALDLKLRRQMQLELKRIQRSLGLTFIYVTHDQEEALTMSDRIAVFNRGRIEQLGPPLDIYHRPATRFVADFIGAANLLEARIVARQGDEAEVLVEEDGSARVPIDGDGARTAAVSLMVRPERLRLAAAEPSARTDVLRLPARIKEVVFMGSSYQILLETSKTRRAVVAVAAEPPAGVSAGAEVSLEADLDTLLVLPEEK